MQKPPKDIRACARLHADRAIERLIDLVERDDVPAATQLAAAKQLLELGYGRPTPRDATASGDERSDEGFTRDERTARRAKDSRRDTVRERPSYWYHRKLRKQLGRERAQRRAQESAAPAGN